MLTLAIVQEKPPRVGDIGDAEVNAKLYKVQLLRAERAIRSLSQRNELVESELSAMHALLRCCVTCSVLKGLNLCICALLPQLVGGELPSLQLHTWQPAAASHFRNLQSNKI